MKILALILPLLFPVLATAEHPSFKIGIVAPLTGSSASSGVTIKNSVQMAQLRFDPLKSVKFLFEDDQLAPKNTVSAVNN